MSYTGSNGRGGCGGALEVEGPACVHSVSHDVSTADAVDTAVGSVSALLPWVSASLSYKNKLKISWE